MMINYGELSLLVEKFKKDVESTLKFKVDLDYNFSDINVNKCELKFSLIREEKIKDVFNTELSKKYGFTQNIIGLEFTKTFGNNTKHYRITEFRPKGRKYKIIAENIQEGMSYKFRVIDIKRYLGGDNLINRAANLDELIP